MQIIVLVQSNHVELGGKPTPDPYYAFLRTIGVFSLDLVQMLPADCIVENDWGHFDSLLFETLGPIIILIFITMGSCVEWMCACVTSNPDSSAPSRKKHFSYFVVVLLLVLPTISRRVCQTYQCRSFDEGEYSLLVADYSISCDSERWRFLTGRYVTK